MEWEVSGADRTTGQDKTLIIEADNEDSARRRANRQGLMVAEVRLRDSGDSGLALAEALPTPPQIPRPAPSPASGAGLSYASRFPRRSAPTPEAPGTSGLGIAALVIGCLALLLSIVPLVGMIAIPIAVIGLLLGIVAIIVSAAGKRSALGMPIAGTVVNAAAFVMPVLYITVFIHTATHVLATMPPPSPAMIRSFAAMIPATAPSSGEAGAGSVGQSATLGNATVQVTRVGLARVPLVSPDGNNSTSPTRMLCIDLQISNNSGTQTIQYRSWAGSRSGADVASLSDDAGTACRLAALGVLKPQGRTDSAAIFAGRSIQDVLVFDPPSPTARTLHLHLPGRNVQASGETDMTIAVP